MFKLKFEITYADASKATATTRPGTDVAFERRFGCSVASLFGDLPRNLDADDPDARLEMVKWFGSAFSSEHTSFLAWHASRDSRDFDAWLDSVEEITWEMAGAPVPTQPAASVS